MVLEGVFISIHAPRVGRDYDDAAAILTGAISIHAPRVGRDIASTKYGANLQQFQSTRPAWGATEKVPEHDPGEEISIHAPRVGRDSLTASPVSL